jgi:F0F1-type ATP synthase delta subunit
MEQLDLSDFFTTKSESLDFSTRLSGIARQIYETGFNLEPSLLTEFGIQKKDHFLSLLRNNQINVASNSALSEFFNLIIQKISSLPVVTLTIAFEPDNQTLRDLSQWFTLNINRQVVFEIIVDPKLIAGAAITYNGRYEDYSVKTKFTQIVASSLSN